MCLLYKCVVLRLIHPQSPHEKARRGGASPAVPELGR